MTTSTIENIVVTAMQANASQALAKFQNSLDDKKLKTNQSIVEQREQRAYNKSLAYFFEPFNGMVYVSQKAGDYSVMGFTGRAVKPVFYYLFKTEVQMLSFITSWAMKQVKSAQAKAERQAERKALQKQDISNFVKVGDVFVSIWGYEQTNVDYYQVVAIKGKSTLTLREISADIKETHYLQGEKTPCKDSFIGEEFDKRATIYGSGDKVRVSINLNSFSSAHLKECEPDGSYAPNHYSSYY